MRDRASLDIPVGLEEEYYQISPDILQSFSKFRPPLNIYRFLENVGRIASYYKVGDRLSKEQTQELADLVAEGVIFVSRDDHPIYVKHISYQLDLVLLDRHLTESEIADIFQIALTRRMEAFFDQPVRLAYDKLRDDALVLTEYVWQDFHRSKALAKRHHGTHSLANHAVNCALLGLHLFLAAQSDGFREGRNARTVLDRMVQGLLLHDLGMTRVPTLIRDKTKPLLPDEMQKIRGHTMSGYEMLARLDIKFPEMERCVAEHHERLDGSGYPQKLGMGNISEAGLLTGVVDSYCAMTSKRIYAPAMEPLAAAKKLLEENRRYPADYVKRLLAFLAGSK
ncbi:HD-GYP domain-containing protein [Solidesulfovibrio sp.]|uniref:HD-GYP domain-containing protein n=1 Tax=Solidesulfovibrio sp. TaxID=2910990 RepID=UPI002B1F60F1|nr:HD domain-containing phosphohydrolase [Solidesulfovibrio sp.]MEA5087482.1 HD domain-containing phosphohydrolase [Solidesulfovibrio sp.]HML61408.1 HD domain-containing phosphohydrolase [Solidesulfovibrio sp.]